MSHLVISFIFGQSTDILSTTYGNVLEGVSESVLATSLLGATPDDSLILCGCALTKLSCNFDGCFVALLQLLTNQLHDHQYHGCAFNNWSSQAERAH